MDITNINKDRNTTRTPKVQLEGRKHCPKGIKDEFPHFGMVRDVGISYAPWTAVKERLMKLWDLNLVDSLRCQWESEENGSLIVIVSTNQVSVHEMKLLFD